MVGRRAELSSGKRMPTVTTSDGVEIFYKDWGSGQPVVFSHGWPLTADVWDSSANVVASHGFRAVAHDRRGGGRSSQPWDGNDLDHYADDLAAVIEALVQRRSDPSGVYAALRSLAS
jgi:non-heme chloroperoxidase